MRNLPIVMIPPVGRGEIGGPCLALVVKVVVVVSSWLFRMEDTWHSCLVVGMAPWVFVTSAFVVGR